MTSFLGFILVVAVETQFAIDVPFWLFIACLIGSQFVWICFLLTILGHVRFRARISGE